MARIIGQERIAEIVGVAPKTIVEWQEQGFPVAVRGGPGVPSEYESVDCIRWLIDRELARVGVEKPGDKLLRLKAEDMELNLAERRGTLVNAEALKIQLTTAIIDAREYLRGEPPRISMLMEGMDRAERQALLQRTFDEFLVRIAGTTKMDADGRAG